MLLQSTTSHKLIVQRLIDNRGPHNGAIREVPPTDKQNMLWEYTAKKIAIPCQYTSMKHRAFPLILNVMFPATMIHRNRHNAVY